MTLVMLRLTSISRNGDIPWANISGSSEKALQKPLYTSVGTLSVGSQSSPDSLAYRDG
jgi:hypothetical protein